MRWVSLRSGGGGAAPAARLRVPGQGCHDALVANRLWAGTRRSGWAILDMTDVKPSRRFLTPTACDALQWFAERGPVELMEGSPSPIVRRRLEAAGYIEQVPPFSTGRGKFRITAAGLRVLAQASVGKPLAKRGEP